MRWMLLLTALLVLCPVAAAAGPDDGPALDDQAAFEREMDRKERERDFEFETEAKKLELDRLRRKAHRGHGEEGGLAVFLLVCLVVNILLTIWVYTDIRARDAGSGLWMVITLLTGLFGAAVYALVRIGDIRMEQAAQAGSGSKASKR